MITWRITVKLFWWQTEEVSLFSSIYLRIRHIDLLWSKLPRVMIRIVVGRRRDRVTVQWVRVPGRLRVLRERWRSHRLPEISVRIGRIGRGKAGVARVVGVGFIRVRSLVIRLTPIVRSAKLALIGPALAGPRAALECIHSVHLV